MARPPLHSAWLVAAGLAFAGPAVAGESAFQAKVSEIGIGHAPGEIRRTIQPFGTWTLTCDENTRRKQRVCNVSQVLVDAVGQTAFSWSLAATAGGEPVMIVRAPNGPGDGRVARLRFRREATLTEVPLTRCDGQTCLGYLQVTPALGAQLRRGTEAEITLVREGRERFLSAPTEGLAAALAALK